MTKPTTIEEFLEGFERLLRLSGRRKQRVLDEARDHLIEARDRGIAAGLDPRAAEIAAIEAFGDPTTVASRFDPGLLARVAGELDRYDRWRAIHPTTGITFGMAPMFLVLATLWSPVVALALLPTWVTFVWVGRQLRGRQEPGYRNRLWGWKHEHPAAYQIATNGASLLDVGVYFALMWLAGSPHPTLWVFPAFILMIPLGWMFESPKRYQSPPAPIA
jgi:hypothetical protein